MNKHLRDKLHMAFAVVIMLLCPISSHSQHRIPNKGENIQFFPIVKEQRQIHTGYDCFYVEDLACKNGQYRFKKSYRFKKGKDKLTPLAEIENYNLLAELN